MSDNPLTLPDHIPAEILEEHLEDARRTVAASYLSGWRRICRQPSLTSAAFLVLLGGLCVAASWGWLTPAGGGSIWPSILAAVGVLAGLGFVTAAMFRAQPGPKRKGSCGTGVVRVDMYLPSTPRPRC